MKKLACLLLIALCCCGGCGSSEAEVSGNVLIDGSPLKEGDILFEEVDKSKTPAAARIVAGKYKLRLVPGKKIVRITASRPARKIDPVMGAAAREQMISKEFNEATKLTADIAAGVREELNFEVKAIP